MPIRAPRTELVVVRHMLERARSTNSARWAVAALPGASLHEWGMPGAPLDVGALVVPDTWLLFPSAQPTPPLHAPPRRLICVDGSWPQARRMVQRIAALHALPRLSLPPPPARPRLRAETVEAGMSTLEAIAAAYEHLGEREIARGLEQLHADAVARSRKIRGRRTV